MPSLKEIKNRIGSVRSTLKITSSMKLVASAKLRKSQTAIENMRPYQQTLQDIVGSVGCPDIRIVSEDSDSRESKPVVVVISSNSSLCGGFNSNVIRKALSVLSENPEAELYTVGRKGADALRIAGWPSVRNFNSIAAHPEYEPCAALAETLTQGYMEGTVSKVLLVYNHFYSSSHQEPVVETFLPMETSGGDGGDFIFEPSMEEIAYKIVPQMLKVKLYTAVLDSAAAEHAARTIAMQVATDNAEDLLSELTLQYNKGRQQKITSEILDIIGGMQ